MSATRAQVLLDETGFVFLVDDLEEATRGTLCLDERVVHGHCDAGDDRIVLRTELGESLAMSEDEVYALALRYSYHAVETGTRLALDEDTGSLVLIADFQTAELDAEAFLTILENFAMRAVIWEELIADWLPDDEGVADDDSETPPDRLGDLLPV